MKYRITGAKPDLPNRTLVITAVQINSSDNKEETAKVEDDIDDLERLLAIFEVSHYDQLVGQEVGNIADATLQDSIDALLILD